MSTKTAAQQQRRTPLSLTGGGKQHNQNQYSGKSADSNGNSNNSASAKTDNKLSASQKTEQTNNDARESTPKDVKKSQNTEKKQPQPQSQQAGNNETAKKVDKVDEKKAQNGAGKAATNGGAREKQQNCSDKQENGNGNASNAKSANSNSNGNVTSKPTTKTNEKSVAPAKEETKSKEQKPAQQQQKPVQNNEKNDKESEKEKEKDKKKENGPEKPVEKETRSRRHDTAAAAEAEKKQSEKTETIKNDDAKIEVSTPTSRSNAAQPKKNSTPTRGVDKSSGASTPTKAVEKLSASQRTKTVTTVIDDVEMEPISVDSSPVKPQKNSVSPTTAVVSVTQPPAATSTPGKAATVIQKTKLQAASVKSEMATKMQSSGSPPDRKSAPRTFTQIAGRRSIRPLTEYTPSKFQGNFQYRESYRRINTELDVSSTTNTSMNVTVGSEVPNSSSFSFFGRGRKRDRTPPPQSQSTIELQTDADYSPPKRARLDMQTFFSVVSSPITMLRSRFSRASLQSSTPMKLTSKLTDNDEAEVQNVSGISIEEEINEGAEEKTATEDVTVGKKSDDDTTPKMDSPMKVDEKCSMEKGEEKNLEGEVQKKSSDVHEVAAGVADTSVTSAKNKRCNVM